MRRWLLVLVAVLVVPFVNLQATRAASSCFSETGQCISGRFGDFWQQNGGLAVFGYPLSGEIQENGHTVQYFERQRFELHQENTAPYDVLLGRLGAEDTMKRGLVATAPFQPLPASTPSDDNCLFFAMTGHRLCLGFKSYWQAHGLELGDPGVTFRESLALFGYPISEEFTDPMTGFTTQYFERARFEYHPNNPEPYKVLLGLLGRGAMPTEGVTNPSVNVAANLDDDPAPWMPVYCEVGDSTKPSGEREVGCDTNEAPSFARPEAVSDPSLDGQALHVGRSGGAVYSNVMFQRRFPFGQTATQASSFLLDLHFLFRLPASGSPSQIQALEFGMTDWLGAVDWDWELQWPGYYQQSNDAPIWRIFNGQSWQETGVSAPLQPDHWYHLLLRGSVVDGQTYYDSFAIDGSEYCLSQSFPPRSIGGDQVTTHVQLDGDQASHAYDVYLDQVSVQWFANRQTAPCSSPSPAPLTAETAANWCSPTCTTRNFSPLVESTGRVNPYGQKFDLLSGQSCMVFRIPSGVQYDVWDGKRTFSGVGPSTLNSVCSASFRKQAT